MNKYCALKKICIIISVLHCFFLSAFSQIGIGPLTTDPSAILELNDSTRGFLPTRITIAQRSKIQNPKEGLVIYNSSTKCLEFFNGTNWISLCDGSISYPLPPDSYQYSDYIKASNTGVADGFGFTVALSADGNTLAVGSINEDGSGMGVNPTDNNNADNSGAVYIYTKIGSTWSFQSYVKANNTGVGDQFGWSVSLSSDGNTLAVGAIFEDGDGSGINPINNNNASNSGAVYIYTRTGVVWDFQSYIKSNNTNAEDRFGWSIALSADGYTLAVGAIYESGDGKAVNPRDNNRSQSSGAAYTYKRTGSTWFFQSYIKAINTGAGDRFGSSVAISADGNTLAIGAWMEDGGGTGVNPIDNNNSLNSGAAYIYVRRDGVWNFQSYIKASNTDGDDNFSYPLALSSDGNTLACGALYEDGNGTGINPTNNNSSNNSGAVYLYTRKDNVWSFQAYIKASNTDPEDNFGQSISLSRDGTTLAVGANEEDGDGKEVDPANNNNFFGAGGAYIYSRRVNSWTFLTYIKASNTEANDDFGYAVALSGDGTTLVVGGLNESGRGLNVNPPLQNDNSIRGSGAVYIYKGIIH